MIYLQNGVNTLCKRSYRAAVSDVKAACTNRDQGKLRVGREGLKNLLKSSSHGICHEFSYCYPVAAAQKEEEKCAITGDVITAVSVNAELRAMRIMLQWNPWGLRYMGFRLPRGVNLTGRKR